VDRRRTSRYDRFAFNRERAKVAETSIQPLVAATLDTTMKVRGRDGGKTIGTLHAFMVHKRSGRAMYAVLSLGGFLGVGKHFYAVPIQLLAYDLAADAYVASVEPKTLEGGPNWSGAAPDFDQAYADRLASYYGAEKQDLTVG
jgi:hypothetical protein